MATKKGAADPGGEIHGKRRVGLLSLHSSLPAPCPSLPIEILLTLQNSAMSYLLQETLPGDMLEALSPL